MSSTLRNIKIRIVFASAIICCLHYISPHSNPHIVFAYGTACITLTLYGCYTPFTVDCAPVRLVVPDLKNSVGGM